MMIRKMRHIGYFVVLGCMAGACLSLIAAEKRLVFSDQQRTAEELAETAREAVVSIVQFGRDGKENGLGAGFCVGSNGLVATSLHVIGEGRAVSVQLGDGTTHDALEVYAWDRKLDLAVLRIAATNIPVLPLADSDELKQGAAVVAIGNPLGLRHSIVQGIVSAKREFEGLEMIQIAIPIESGNSGGPLLDMHGRVHGVLTLKSALSPNLGFAMPVNALKALLDKPNRVPLNRWLMLGTLKGSEWTNLFGARWTQRAGIIHVENPGLGFGGRALCLSRSAVPTNSYEVAVRVKLEDETGAAGLVFGSDGAEKHYGFYPSAGQIRLTRFEGPTVFSWNILSQVKTAHYQPGEWNDLRVRVEADRILGYVNDQLIVDATNNGFAGHQVGLAKFRDTKASFGDFQAGGNLNKSKPPVLPAETMRKIETAVEAGDDQLTGIQELGIDLETSARFLSQRARQLEKEAARMKQASRALQRQHIQAQLSNELARAEPDIDLFRAALLIGKFDYPEVEIHPYVQQLETMARELRSRLGKKTTPESQLSRLVEYLFEENGFHGSRTDYYNQAISHMHQVLDDREGLPISLSVLFLELGRHAGITNLTGVPLPGHFMVRWETSKKSIFIDVFDGGKRLSTEQARDLITDLSGQAPEEQHFRPANKRDIVIRMLRNLYGVAVREDNLAAALGYLDLIVALSPNSPERMNRGLLRLRAGLTREAKEDFRHLLDTEPEGLNLERLAELYRSLEER